MTDNLLNGAKNSSQLHTHKVHMNVVHIHAASESINKYVVNAGVCSAM